MVGECWKYARNHCGRMVARLMMMHCHFTFGNPVRLTMESGNSNYNYCTSFYSLGQNNVIPLKTYKITN